MSEDTLQPEDKKPERIEPTMQFFVLCDNIAQAGTKPVLVGVFDQLVRPGPVPQFIIAMRWTNGVGNHSVEIRVLDPDLESLATFKGDIELQHRAANATVIFNVVNFEFRVAGVYWFEVRLNDQMAAAIPLPVQRGS